MIKVRNLTKNYGDFTALNNISFDVKEGEIVGFLGANGAGKTTTMRILTGFLPATHGKVEVAGFDIASNSLNVRKNIGYLPENVPLYLDMRVREYLTYRAKIKGLDKFNAKKNITDVIDKCWLGDVNNKMIGSLSKGYRQRVGLADALLHKPKLLILDEPTVGLDPNQIIKIRELIKELGREFTIFLSSHILPEVEMVCNKIIIVHNGEIVAKDSTEKLCLDFIKAGNIHAEIKCDDEDLVKESLSKLEGVVYIELLNKEDNFCHFKINTKEGKDIREDIYSLSVDLGWKLRELTFDKATLEDVFMHITK